MTEQTLPKRALVLSGGGGRGAFQAGVLEHLESIGWKPDIIVGTSIGSMNAAVYAPIGVEDNQHWDGAVMYNSPLRPAIDAEADEILMVLLSPYHKLEENDPRPLVQRSALPPMPRGLIGSVGYVLDLALIGTFENDFEELRKVNRRVRKGAKAAPDHKEVRCAVIAPDEWISPLDIIRYGPKRSAELRALGRQAARQTFQRIDRLGWDSLYHVDED